MAYTEERALVKYMDIYKWNIQYINIYYCNIITKPFWLASKPLAVIKWNDIRKWNHSFILTKWKCQGQTKGALNYISLSRPNYIEFVYPYMRSQPDMFITYEYQGRGAEEPSVICQTYEYQGRGASPHIHTLIKL